MTLFRTVSSANRKPNVSQLRMVKYPYCSGHPEKRDAEIYWSTITTLAEGGGGQLPDWDTFGSVTLATLAGLSSRRIVAYQEIAPPPKFPLTHRPPHPLYAQKRLHALLRTRGNRNEIPQPHHTLGLSRRCGGYPSVCRSCHRPNPSQFTRAIEKAPSNPAYG